MTDLPASAKIVVIGGGIVGCSTAYHLGKIGLADVLLLERAQALLRLDLARRRPGRPAPHQRQHHPAARLFRRALRPAGGGDRPRHRLEDERRPAPRLQRRALDRGEAPGDHRALLRPRDAAPDPEGGAGPLAADDGRRRRRRRLPADRRPGLALRHRPGAGPRRAHRRRRHPRGHPRHRHPPSRTAASPASTPPTGASPARRSCICAGQWSRELGRDWPASTSRSSACSTST